MTQTDLTMPLNFEETKLFILSINPTVAAKIVGSMASSSWRYYKPSNIPHGWHSKFIKDVEGDLFLGSCDIPLSHSWSIASNSALILAIEIQNLDKTIWLGLEELYKLSIWSKDQSMPEDQYCSHLKIIPVINLKNHIVKWNIWENVPYSTGTIRIFIHIPTLVFRS